MKKCPHCGQLIEETTAPENEVMRWFNEWWALYPRHVGKAAALKAWKKAATSEAIKDEIIAALKCQLAGMMRQDNSFIPHASTWLNGRRFEDECPASSERPANVQRKIACELCGDTGIMPVVNPSIIDADSPDPSALLGYARCSCARGQLPGLVIPQAEADDPAPF